MRVQRFRSKGVGMTVRRAGIAAVAAAGLAPATAQAANVNVTFTGSPTFRYSPDTVRIAPGDTVTWIGATPATTFAPPTQHPLQWPAGQFPTFDDPVNSHSEVFATAGRYAYRCAIHFAAGMVGSVTVSANRPPVAAFTVTAARVGEPVTFTSTSSDPNPGQTLSYQWDLDGDGAYDPGVGGPTVSRTYASPGTVTVRLRVTDSNNDVVGPESAETSQAVTIAGAVGTSAVTRPVIGVLSTSLRRTGRVIAVRVRSLKAGRATLSLRRSGRTLARGTTRFTRAGTRTARLRLTRRGRSAIRRGRRVRATLVVSLRDTTRNTATLRRQVRVRG